MGKSSGGNSSQPTVPTSTTQTSEPWGPVQEPLKYGIEQAGDWYNNPDVSQYYPNATYTEMAPQTDLGLQLTENRALSGSPLQDAGREQYMNTLQGGNLYANPGFNLMSPFATGNFSTPGTGMIAAGGMGANPADQYLQGTAQGNYLNQDNPALAAVGDRLQNQIQPRVASQFAGSGRAGSGAHEEQFTRSMADAMAPYMYGNYENERGRQLAAAQALQGSERDRFGRMMGAGGQLAGIGAGERATQLGAAGNIAGMYQNAANQQYGAMMNAPQYAMQDYNDYARLMGVGDAYQNQENQILGDSIARHQFNTDQPYTKLAQYMGLLGGQYGGTQTGTGVMENAAYGSNTDMQNLMGLGQLGLAAYKVFGVSSRDYKTEVDGVSGIDMLDALREMPVKKWRYKQDVVIDPAQHVGPMAEDWQAATGLGDGRTINLIDAVGVLISAVKALDAEVQSLRAERKEK